MRRRFSVEPISCAAAIVERGRQQPDEVVYWHAPIGAPEQGITWGELARWSGHLALELAQRGVGAGDRLAIGLRNSPAFVASAFAAWRLGAVPVPVRWDLPAWELERVHEVIGAPVNLGPDDLAWIDETGQRPGEPDLPEAPVSPNIHGICSSGSTGLPKVILSKQPAIVSEVFGTPIAASWAPIPRPQTILVLAPMYHVNGFVTLYNMFCGDRAVVLEKFDAARIVDLIEAHKVTTFTATPTMLKRIADVAGIEERDLSSIEWVLQGAAPMPPTLVERWIELIGSERLIMAYGMTEGLGTTAIRGDEWLEHRGSVGKGRSNTELRILDSDGNDLPAGEVGDVFLRSPMYGGSVYLGGAALLRGTDDGFQTAGDMGYLDDDGFLYLVDRRVDLIVSGGANVFPAEVEAALIDHPAIADVVVIGLKDEEWGRRVHALIEAKDPSAPPTRDEIVTYAKSRLAAYKVPKSIEIVDEIPRSAATKVSRGALVDARGG
jgi:bile acid-coenzyme A ligase